MIPTTLTRLERARGALLGHLMGDALGAPYEFRAARNVPKPADLRYGPGVFGHPAGTGTDDTAVMRIVARVLIDCGGDFDATRYGAALTAWADTGPLDIGGQTARAARAWAKGSPPLASRHAQGNGALMAAAPCGFAPSPVLTATALSGASHPSAASVAACVQYADAIAYIIRGTYPTEESATVIAAADEAGWTADGDSIGWCIGTAALAFRALALASDGLAPPAALRWVVAQGGDTDTNGAVAGAMLGAAFGEYPFAELLDGLSPDDVAQNLLLAEHLARLT